MSTTPGKKPTVQKVLVIEDEGDMCLLLELLLDSKELAVDHVKSLSEARKFLQTEQPALVLLDNRLPDGMGLDFISYIKSNHPRTKIIMMSGIDAAAEDVALEVGADTFLCKPFTKAQLHATIKPLLN